MKGIREDSNFDENIEHNPKSQIKSVAMDNISEVPKKVAQSKKIKLISVIVIIAVLIGGILVSKYLLMNKKNTTEKIVETEKKETEKNEISIDYKKIEDQCFDVELDGIGQVRFESYAPDTSKERNADAVFKIVNGDSTYELPGIETNNVRLNKIFEGVEAVAFDDYNGDQKDDIFVINRYEVNGITEDESRVYKQGNDGQFTLDEKLTSDINNNIDDKTIANIKDFIQSSSNQNNESVGDWKQAYKEWLNQQATDADYYLFDLDKDNIPEIAVCSVISAYGTKLVAYNDEKIQETQVGGNLVLYTEGEEIIDITGGSMDEYYDQLYTVQNGKWTLVAKGEYGAEDNSNVQFDENNQPIYIYKWNGEIVDQDDYNKTVNSYMTRGNGINTIPLSYDEIFDEINSY